MSDKTRVYCLLLLFIAGILMIIYGSMKFHQKSFIPISVFLFNKTEVSFANLVSNVGCHTTLDISSQYVSCDGSNIPTNNPDLNGTCFLNQFCNQVITFDDAFRNIPIVCTAINCDPPNRCYKITTNHYYYNFEWSKWKNINIFTSFETRYGDVPQIDTIMDDCRSSCPFTKCYYNPNPLTACNQYANTICNFYFAKYIHMYRIFGFVLNGTYYVADTIDNICQINDYVCIDSFNNKNITATYYFNANNPIENYNHKPSFNFLPAILLLTPGCLLVICSVSWICSTRKQMRDALAQPLIVISAS